MAPGFEGPSSDRLWQGGYERAPCNDSPLARRHDNPSIQPVFVWWPITDRASLHERPPALLGRLGRPIPISSMA